MVSQVYSCLTLQLSPNAGAGSVDESVASRDACRAPSRGVARRRRPNQVRDAHALPPPRTEGKSGKKPADERLGASSDGRKRERDGLPLSIAAASH